MPRVETCKDVNELTKAINVLDAITWARDAWDDLSKDTIGKCFSRCGFKESSDSSDFDEDDDIPLIELISRFKSDSVEVMPVQEYLSLDSDVQVHD